MATCQIQMNLSRVVIEYKRREYLWMLPSVI